MGTVYRARDPILDRPVALKTIAQGLLAKQESIDRFQREARAAARLQHRNIVTIYELGEVGGTVYIAMELLEGVDLAQAMVPHDRLSPVQKAHIVADVCRGLDYAHKRGVVHRDVKPANVILVNDGSVKLVDFGIARLENSTMTQTGLILGTPSYIAPEILKGGAVDHRADIWALGVVSYELFSGRLPFNAPTIAALVYKIVNEPPPAFDAAGLGFPPAVTGVIARALEKEPGRRYQDLSQMAGELAGAMGLSTSAETPLFGAAREEAYARDVKEARRLMAAGDLERALEAARRARALVPSRTEVVMLVGEIEDQLREAPTLVRGVRPGTEYLTLTPIEAASFPEAAAPPAPAGPSSYAPIPAPALAERRLPTAVLTELRARGASVFREIATFGEPPAISATCLSPVRDILATSGADGAIRLWDLQSRVRILTLRTELHQRTGHDALATALAFSPDGLLLASGHVDGSVHLWDLTKGDEVAVKLRHDASVGGVGFSPDCAALATGGLDSSLKLWDVNAALAGEARRVLIRQPSAVTALSYAGNGALIVTGHANRVLRVIDAATGRLRATLRGPEAQVTLVRLSPDGRRLAVASQDRTVRLFDLAAQAQVGVMTGHRRPPTSLSFFGDGAHMATVALENAVQLWDVESRSMLAALWGPAADSFSGVALFGGGDHIAVALADGRIRIWGPAS
jgi:hypothetical protein